MKLFDIVIEKEKKNNPNKWVFSKDLDIKDESDWITYLTFETDEERGFNLFKVRKSFRGIMKERKINKDEVESKLVLICSAIMPNEEGLEELCNDFEVDFKTEEEMKEYINLVKENDYFAMEKNKENIFFDTRRYFWKYENQKLSRITL